MSGIWVHVDKSILFLSYFFIAEERNNWLIIGVDKTENWNNGKNFVLGKFEKETMAILTFHKILLAIKNKDNLIDLTVKDDAE